MEAIEKHWGISKAKGLAVVDEQGFPIEGGHRLPGQRRVLGGRGSGVTGSRTSSSSSSSSNTNTTATVPQPDRDEIRRRCMEAAKRRKNTQAKMGKLGLGRSYVLGGGTATAGVDKKAVSVKPLTLNELRAARMDFFRKHDAAHGLANDELEFAASQQSDGERC